MNRLFIILGLLSFCLAPATAQSTSVSLEKDITFHRYEVPLYHFSALTPRQVLPVEYAGSTFTHDHITKWTAIAPKVKVYEIDLVFTLYPKNINSWRTNYFKLLQDRIEQLFEIDPSLRDPDITWNLILQTQCTSEEEAKELFHGFVIKFRPIKPKVVEDIKTFEEVVGLIRGTITTRDSTIFKILERNPEWDSMLIIADWTGSMYTFGAQLALWYKLQYSVNRSRVSHFVFFNDGNNKKTALKKIGKTGGVYHAASTSVEDVAQMMGLVMKKGNGGDSPENDIEAIITGIDNLQGYKDILLIADNRSEVRDISLIDRIAKPVHVILCDVVSEPIHEHYLRIAESTGGSIHTLKDDMFFIGTTTKTSKLPE